MNIYIYKENANSFIPLLCSSSLLFPSLVRPASQRGIPLRMAVFILDISLEARAFLGTNITEPIIITYLLADTITTTTTTTTTTMITTAEVAVSVTLDIISKPVESLEVNFQAQKLSGVRWN